MTPQAGLFLSSIAFVGSHLLLSHPLRRPLARRIKERAFQGLYSLIAFATLGATIYFYRAIGDEQPLWVLGEWAWIAGALLMWLASILLVGSFRGNPAMVGSRGPKGGPAGVFGITRHPMMWSFAIWAAVHLALIGTAKAMVLDGAILILAIVGAMGQDRKKAHQMGDNWHEWTAQTAFVPFTRGLANPGAFALIGGTILFLLASWLHPMPVGIWRLVG